MKIAGACVTLGIAIVMAASVAVQAEEASQSGSPASLDLLKKAVDPNPSLQSYIASATLSAKLHAVVPVSETFNGTVYYLKPTRKIVFENVPGALSKFKDLTSTTPTYEQALAEYSITPKLDDGTMSTYSLVPKNQGSRVTNLAVAVDDKAALIIHAVWTYNDGGTLSFDQTYQNVGAFRVPAQDTIAARFPGYSVDGTIKFSGYQPNAPVAPSIFNNKQ